MELGNKVLVCFVVMIGLFSLSVSVHACQVKDIKTSWLYLSAKTTFRMDIENRCNCDAKNIIVKFMDGYTEKPGRKIKATRIKEGGIMKAGEIIRKYINDPFPGRGPLYFELEPLSADFFNCK
ncbi:hypothetical protein SUGI_0381660 [Cryptomeria japonica]|nr:hypothetical protein SUGI_0381660 [Cryptomeria japonica]